MIITHKINWDKCLSHQIFPAIEKGWQDNGKPIHFFWGLGGDNIRKINEVKARQEEWWFVDVGYLTEQITRYPTPSINDINKTYFRICKGGIHTKFNHTHNPNFHRVQRLRAQGIDVEFKGWQEGNHILVCPSSPTVTKFINNCSQEQWIQETVNELKKHTDKEIAVRNKPRPGNQWWGTDIKDSLKDCHALVTNMSLSAIDAVMNKVPVITSPQNVCVPISYKSLLHMEDPLLRPEPPLMNLWVDFVVNNQFTIAEIESGIAYNILTY